ncbi:tRNA (N6-isopentenyl adenosine(37)-C2)-methylthiotransferase MiaB [Fusibacter ferrireducens]|uniref:tRNA-2-methylthio-N(6)-dimethylallyladenosine synthase n=2 Tax=Fusibacter ferrireducens TaxID=2785058 RepID=A0ABR9ZT56_9FIRM|nr:tRNA (N6-isopentenyl adenosine(37)-C2)-methylthiotransferase MiaB [Fusibacter ferrireducens]MBF4693620.1 tRNA (N6-isopentenyl adenosine(37)-C2)-methylthiotransferase MiaB [Fusibacter ferrireducens]
MSNREILNMVSVEELLNKNDEIIRNIREINDQIYREEGKQKKAIIVTYGCQMNEHDSEKLDAMIQDMGYVMVKKLDQADLVIFNTCCVRENAELKVYGNLGRIKHLKETKKDLVLAVCGCMMQQPHVVEAIKKQYKYVDLVFGTHNLHNFPSLLEETLSSHKQVVEVWESEGDVVEGLAINRKKDIKAYVNVMYGCDNFCAYCIVPYTRGRERSRQPEDILEEIQDLVNNGVKEITLLGQNVNSYGKTLESPMDFADLMRKVNDIKGIERIRFMTSHPKDISDKLLETMAECEHVCEYLHLPIQAGSNRILKAMNRKYTREQYLEIVDKARKLMPDVSISTDLIIGFPGETRADFEETLSLMKEVQFDSAFTYIYSKRTGTPAALIEPQIDEAEKHQRMTELLAMFNPMVNEKIQSHQDEILEVLVEGASKSSDQILMGRTRQHVTVNFEGDLSLTGKLVKVKATQPKKFSIFGELVEVVR